MSCCHFKILSKVSLFFSNYLDFPHTNKFTTHSHITRLVLNIINSFLLFLLCLKHISVREEEKEGIEMCSYDKEIFFPLIIILLFLYCSVPFPIHMYHTINIRAPQEWAREKRIKCYSHIVNMESQEKSMIFMKNFHQWRGEQKVHCVRFKRTKRTVMKCG